jgi:hypothetical protein
MFSRHKVENILISTIKCWSFIACDVDGKLGGLVSRWDYSLRMLDSRFLNSWILIEILALELEYILKLLICIVLILTNIDIGMISLACKQLVMMM